MSSRAAGNGATFQTGRGAFFKILPIQLSKGFFNNIGLTCNFAELITFNSVLGHPAPGKRPILPLFASLGCGAGRQKKLCLFIKT